MKLFRPKLNKNNQEKNRSITQALFSDEDKEKEPTDKVDKHPKIDEKVEKNTPKKPSKDNLEHEVISRSFFLNRRIDKKLTIILIENTSEVAKEKETLIKIINSLVSEGLVSIINYGTVVRQSEIFDVSTFDNSTCLCNDDIGNKACLYDALVNLEDLVSKEYMHIEEKGKERIRINKIEVIGIGTCKDNSSKVSKEVGINCFCNVVTKREVITKYFCLTEAAFMDAAEIGFHSIGAIFRNY